MTTMTRTVVTDPTTGEPTLDPETGRVKVVVTVPPLPGEEQGHAVITGPKARGVVTMSDGTLYDVTPDIIQVSERHVSGVGFHIAKQLEANGHLAELLHEEGYDGPTCRIIGDETSHAHAHVGDPVDEASDAPDA